MWISVQVPAAPVHSSPYQIRPEEPPPHHRLREPRRPGGLPSPAHPINTQVMASQAQTGSAPAVATQRPQLCHAQRWRPACTPSGHARPATQAWPPGRRTCSAPARWGRSPPPRGPPGASREPKAARRQVTPEQPAPPPQRQRTCGSAAGFPAPALPAPGRGRASPAIATL